MSLFLKRIVLVLCLGIAASSQATTYHCPAYYKFKPFYGVSIPSYPGQNWALVDCIYKNKLGETDNLKFSPTEYYFPANGNWVLEFRTQYCDIDHGNTFDSCTFTLHTA